MHKKPLTAPCEAMRRVCSSILGILLILGVSLAVIGLPRMVTLPLLAVSEDGNESHGVIAWLDATAIPGGGSVYAESSTLSRIDTQATSRFAVATACRLARIDCAHMNLLLHIRADAPVISGPSASAAIAIATLSLGTRVPLENTTAITATLSSTGLLGPVGGVDEKLKAAAAHGIRTVVISRFTNTSNLTIPPGIRLVQAVTLRDAAHTFNTAFDRMWPAAKPLIPPSSYQEGMRTVAEELCAAAADVEDNSTTQLSAANTSLQQGWYYAAASYCFSAYRDSLQRRAARELRAGNTSMPKLSRMAEDDAFRALLKLNASRGMLNGSAERLQLASILEERVWEMRDAIGRMKRAMEANKTDAFLDAYALVRSRAMSIHGWLRLANWLPVGPSIDTRSLRNACMTALEHAREKLSYASLFDASLREGIARAEAAVTENPAYCAFKAEKTRAEADLVITLSMLPREVVHAYALANHNETGRLLALKAAESRSFPIMAYSYYEYAGSLLSKENPPDVTVILYDTYAAELATLFPAPSRGLPRFSMLPRMLGIGMLFAVFLLLPCLLLPRAERIRVTPLRKRREQRRKT